MQDKDDENIEIENTTKYGEFVTSYFAWIPLEKQKKKAKEMEESTKDNKFKKNYWKIYIKCYIK